MLGGRLIPLHRYGDDDDDDDDDDDGNGMSRNPQYMWYVQFVESFSRYAGIMNTRYYQYPHTIIADA